MDNLRIAWLGPFPTRAGGVSFVATQLLHGLADLGVDVVAFIPGAAEDLPPELRTHAGISFVPVPSRWRYDRWYSSNDLMKFLSGSFARWVQMHRTGRLIREMHACAPFDVIYQFSAPELGGLRSQLRRLPPVVLHPEVHAAGELRWHWRERRLISGWRKDVRFYVAAGVLAFRALLQRRDMPRAALTIAPSARFASLLHKDCGVRKENLTVIPNPIDLERFRAGDGNQTRSAVMFVSRISARKGVQDIVALSHRLGTSDTQARLDVIGDRSMWSDYRQLLEHLHPCGGSWTGSASAQAVADRVRDAAVLVQPSRYEPFALTVAEALASGIPVVVTDEVGAGEGLTPPVCEHVAPGDVAGLEAAILRILAHMRDPVTRKNIQAMARAEAEQRFSQELVAGFVCDALRRASDGGR